LFVCVRFFSLRKEKFFYWKTKTTHIQNNSYLTFECKS
jgi:hypothetical protein